MALTQKESIDPIAKQIHTFRNVVVESAKLKDIASPDFVKNTFGLFDVEMGKITDKLKKELAQYTGSEEIKIKFPSKKDKNTKSSMPFD